MNCEVNLSFQRNYPVYESDKYERFETAFQFDEELGTILDKFELLLIALGFEMKGKSLAIVEEGASKQLSDENRVISLVSKD